MDLTEVVRKFKSELPAFKEMTEKFYNGEMTVKEYKGFSGRYGSYAQRGANANMLRLRLSGGCIDKDKLKFIADSIAAYDIDQVHFTTCQTIQLHNLDAQTVFELMEEAIDHGIITWGGGGDFPRNVMVSPLSGVERGEYFDVMPYARAAADYLLTLINDIKMPRKLKVGFSNCPANVTHATFRDLGFVATPDGTFDVYSAGGLGANPKMGLCVDKGVKPNLILYYIRTMIEVFIEHGNYENRAKARTRYMQDVLGQEGYIAAFQEKLAQVMAAGEDLGIEIHEQTITKTGDGSKAAGARVTPQKQDGLYAVLYHPLGGCPEPSKLKTIYETIKDMKDVELRLSPDQGVYIVNCTGDEAGRLAEAAQDGANTLFESSVACIGSAICQAGVRDSQKVMRELAKEARNHEFADGALPRIHISGCPSSCGTHQIGTIGFHGGVKLVDKVPAPAFTLHINGCKGEGREQFGEKLGVILEKDIPRFMMEVGETVSSAGMVFAEWFPDHEETLKEIAGKYLQ